MATTTLFSMLSNLVYSFVLMQAEILAYLRPAQFLVGRLLKKNRAHVIFTVRFPASAPVFAADAPHPEKHAGAVLQILKGIGKQNPNFHLVKAVVLKDGETGRFEAWHLSNTLKWVDVVEMTLLPTANGVMIEARSCSTSIVPASVPFAPLWAPFFWWLPFDDHYQNYAHLRNLRQYLSEQGFMVEEDILVRGNCFVDTFEGKMGKDHGRVDFHAAEAMLKSQ